MENALELNVKGRSPYYVSVILSPAHSLHPERQGISHPASRLHEVFIKVGLICKIRKLSTVSLSKT